jgi:hypothetical protein
MPFNTFDLKSLIITLLALGPLILFAQQSNNPKVIGLKVKKSNKINSLNQIAWERDVRYLGVYKDTLFVDSINTTFSPINPFVSKADRLKYYGKENFLTTPLSLTIDTTQIINTSDLCISNHDVKIKHFESFPVFITNTTDSLALIGFGTKVNIILEALDIDKKWKAIEKPFIYKCGNGLNDIYLKPDEICCTLIPIYRGNFSTQLRLNINGSYSKPYRGQIYRTQFVD